LILSYKELISDNSNRIESLKKAISICPERPEAYNSLCSHFEYLRDYQNLYKYAREALAACNFHVEYIKELQFPGKYIFKLYEAIAAWEIGHHEESRKLFLGLLDFTHEMTPEHRQVLQQNISSLGCGGSLKKYNKEKYDSLRVKFKNAEKIIENYSQVYQDLFVLSVYNGKNNGTYLEIGSGPSHEKNNTLVLERYYGWAGLGIEIDPSLVDDHKNLRKNTVLCLNALEADYDRICSKITNTNVIDYLQVDCEPPDVTYNILLKIPFEKYKFGVITYEHDYYADVTKSYREKSRNYLASKGYELVVNDMSVDGTHSFEDWWVHPDLISKETIEKIKDVSEKIKDPDEYMFPNNQFDWGMLGKNKWFLETVNQEIFKDNIYHKFFEVEENDVVFDVGASVGPFTYSILYKKPKKVICFEPRPDFFKTLHKNLSDKDTDIVLINRAIGGVNDRFKTKGLYDERGSGATWEIENEVDGIRFDTVIKENGIETIDFLKTDCECGEYDIFNDENFDWITKNVRKIAGEWHITPEHKEKFRHFRDTYLKHFKNIEVYSIDGVDIKWQLFTDDFIEYYKLINLYIDNRDAVKKKKDYWKVTSWPTMEFTTNIAEIGCVVDCAFCPQRTLEKTYKSDVRRMSFDDFKTLLDKLPQEIRITFAGFTEPWLNRDCTDMALYAHERGHKVAAFTTAVGMKIDDVIRLKDIPFADGPNSGFCLHLPDQERIAKHPINSNYIKVIEVFGQVCHEIKNFQLMCMSQTVHESVRHVFSNAHYPEFWSRSGNLLNEFSQKPELLNYAHIVKSVYHGESPKTCNQIEDIYHNVVLPNGDVYLCCQDYALKHKLGNLFEEDYDDIVPKNNSCFDLCRFCENGIDPK